MAARDFSFATFGTAKGRGSNRAAWSPSVSRSPAATWRSRADGVSLRICLGASTLFCATTLLLGGPAVGGEPGQFRLGFSSSTFGEANENDAMAAVKIWSKTLAEICHLSLDPRPQILNGPTEIAQALRDRSLEAIHLTADEYWILRGQLAPDRCILGIQNESSTEEYVLLVRQDSGMANTGDLRGRSLAIYESPRTRLAPIWLGTLLLKEKRGRTADYCGPLTSFKKLTLAVLPVFFRKVEACLVTRRGFETMVELNPQVGRDLKVIATSPALVPFLFAFRADYNSPVRDDVPAQLNAWHATTAGRQLLTMFQCDRVEAQPLSVLTDTMKLMDEHVRLRGATNRVDAAVPTRTPGATEAEGT